MARHGDTNLKGFDAVWAPFTEDEFSKQSSSKCLLDRIYRSEQSRRGQPLRFPLKY